MRPNLYTALVSSVAVLTLIFAEPATTSAGHDAHHQKNHRQASKRASHRTKAKRKVRRRGYVCPMHPDIREKSAGTCPKCLMDLVAEPGKVKPNPKNSVCLSPLSHSNIVRALLEKGANVTARDKEGDTALDYMRNQKHKEVEETLPKAKTSQQ